MFCSLKNIDVYYEELGEGIPVIMLHGYGVDHRMMKGAMEGIFQRRKGFKRIYIDLPGMGKTKGEHWITSCDIMLGVIEQFVDKIIPNKEFIIAAYSYGGYIARGLIKKKKDFVKGVIMICPVTIPDRRKRTVPQSITLETDKELIKTLDDYELKNFQMVYKTVDTWKRYESEVLAGLKDADKQFLRNFRSSGYSFSFDEELENEIYKNIKALIITGRYDSVVGYVDSLKISRCFPGAANVTIDNAGHDLQIEQAEEFRALVQQWLDKNFSFKK